MRHLYLLFIGVGILLTTGCATTSRNNSGVTTLKLSGSAGIPFTGFYVRDGQHVDVADVIPWTFKSAGITTFEFKKTKPDAAIEFEAFYDESVGAHTTQAMAIPSGVVGLRGRVMHHGLSIELLP
jgi:hypothetical protein